MLSIVIVSHGHEVFFEKQIISIVNHATCSYEVIVVDNIGNGEFYRKRLKELNVDHIIVSNFKPKSFSKNNNLAVSLAKYDYILILNPDTYFINYSIFKKVVEMNLDKGLFFPQLLNPDLTIQSSAKPKPNLLFQIYKLIVFKLLNKKVNDIGDYWYFGAAIIVTKQFYREIGGFDEIFPMYAEDTELCDRVRKMGFSVSYLKDCQIVHHLGGESKTKHLGKAIISNMYYRYKSLKNSLKFNFRI